MTRETPSVSKEPESVEIKLSDGPCAGMEFTLTMKDCVINYDAPMILWGQYRYEWSEDRTSLTFSGMEEV